MNILSVSVSKRQFELLSLNSLAVVLQFDDERLHVLALSLPVADAPLSIRVEVLLLLVKQSLRFHRVAVLISERVFNRILLHISLLLEELDELLVALALFLTLLLLSKLQLLVADLPELGELFLFLDLVGLLLLAALDLEGARPLDGLFHFELAALLLLIETVGFVLGLSHLLVQHLLLVVAESAQLLHLLVDELLTDLKLMLLAGLDRVDAHLVHGKLFLGELLNASFLLELFLAGKFCHANLIGVGLHDVGLDASGLLLPLELADLLAFEVLLGLALDELALEHLLLELLNVVDLEFLELVGDGLCVLHLLVVLALELGSHLGIVFLHLLLLKLFPVALDLLSDGGLASFVGLLGFLFLHDIGHEHLGLEGLDHVLVVVQLTVSFLNLLATELVLEVLLFRVHFSTCDLNGVVRPTKSESLLLRLPVA